jgi:hypothetical protein
MSETPDSLTLVFLRRLDGKMDRVIEELGDIKGRVTSLEIAVTQLHGDFSRQSLRIDRLEQRLERIERRLDLLPA